MAKQKRWATKDDFIVDVNIPITEEEIENRQKDYNSLNPKRFATRYNHMLYQPTTFILNGLTYSIQYNYCINPFCHNFSKEQTQFNEIKGKPSRYKIIGTSNDTKRLFCNNNPLRDGHSLNCTVIPLSNWSVAQEIQRLIRIESVLDIDPDYEFHKEGCSEYEATPF